MISAAGVYDIPLAEYLRDPAPEPSLSAGIGWTLLTRTPRHAWADHPRLGAMSESKQSKEMDLGTVAHRLLLGKGGEGRRCHRATGEAPSRGHLCSARWRC
jgi:hypothetical protein